MTKRVLAFLMCAMMIFSSAPFSPFSEFMDFAVNAVAAEEGLKVTVAKITVFEKSQGKLVPVATYNGKVLESGVTYTWSSNKPSVATVDQNGVVKGVAPGEVEITVVAKYGNTKVTYVRPLEVVRFKGVEKLEPEIGSSISMLEKEDKTISVFILPITATNKKLRWTSSNEGVVKVLSSGVDEENSKSYVKIRAIGEGTAKITYATLDGTQKSGSFTVTVKPLIKSLYIPAHVVITTTSTGSAIKHQITPSNAGKTTLIWSSDNEKVCTVDTLGVVRPNKNKQPGVCYVTAKTTDGSNITAKTYVVVTDGTKRISLDKTSLSMKVGDQGTNLTATCVMNSGTVYKDAVNWTSSNTAVATVDMNGVVTAKGPGTAKITAATADGSNLKVVCNVSVTQPVKGVTLPAAGLCWVKGTKQLTPTFSPANATDKKVIWSSSDTSVATVSSKGVVTGKKVGSAVITVKTNDGGYQAQCKIQVEIPPTSVALSSSSVTLIKGSSTQKSVTLTAAVSPANATNKDVIWSSSDTKVATVNSKGKVTAVAGGKAVITCTTKRVGKQATCTVTVKEDATSISITNVPENFFVTQTHTLKIKFSSETVTNKKVSWSSSDSDIVVVDDKGKLTARAEGSAVIKATYTKSDGKKTTAKCTVFVHGKTDVTKVKLNKSKKKIYTKVGSKVYLYETVSPSDASNKEVKWSSSDKSVASVSSGTVKAKVPGEAKITVKTVDGGKTDYCIVYVVAPIEFENATTKVGVGSSEHLSLVSENPSNTAYTWKSSNEAVATVDKNGVVTGIKSGSTTITASTPGGLYTAKCKVNVTIPVTGIKLNAETIVIPKGEKRKVTYTVSPSKASDQKVTWTTPSQSVPIVTINASGQIEGKRVGSTTVTVKTNDGSYTDTITVNVIQPVSSIGFEYSSITLEAGKKKTLTPQILPIGATHKKVKWSSSNKKIVKVDSKGVVTAVAAGTANITCTSADGFAKTKIKVTVTQPPTGIKFNSKKVNVKIGTPKKVSPVILPETASNKNVIFSSSNEKIAKVSPEGVVTGVKKGTAKITATTADSRFSAQITVNVQKPVKKVSLNKTSVTITVGRTTTITPTVSPKSASNKNVKWKSSDNDVVTVSKTGVVTAKAPGYAIVTCTSVDGGKKAECAVFVNQPVKGIKLNKTKLILDIDQSFTLKSTFKPSNASNRGMKWSSSNTKVVKVNQNGVLKPVATGTATITVTTVEGGFKATCKVTVVKRVKSVHLPSEVTVYLGEKKTLNAVLTPEKPSNLDVTWSSSEKSVATVKNGVITPKKTGATKITVTTDDGDLKATCKVTVKRALKSFTLNKKEHTLNKGATYTLKVNKKPSDATETVTFTTSNKKVATVNSKGVVTAKSKGTATITAKSERGITYKCKITVKQPVTSMYISKTSANVYVGDKLNLKANVLPENANNKAFTWSSSDTSVATVSGGTVTPKKAGKVIITVKSENGKTASCTVTVKQHVTSIAFNKTALTVNKGATASLKVTVKPADATEKGYTISSSDTKVVTVSAKGVIKAKAVGTATITVRSKENGKTATCKVTVRQPVTSMYISKTSASVYMGEKLTLKANVLPKNAYSKAFTWSSSDTSVVTVNDGTVIPKKVGKAVITVKSKNGKTASCTVTVKQHVTSIAFNKTTLNVDKGTTASLKVTVKPANATEKGYTITSSDTNIASVTAKGVITAKTPGTATITVRSKENGKTATCKVTVRQPVTSMYISKTSADVYMGEKLTLSANVLPQNAYNKAFTWSSSDTSVVTVSDGTVTPKKVGTAVITVKSENGKTASCTVTVKQHVTAVSFDKTALALDIGATASLKVTVSPANATEKGYTISSSDTNIASVTAEGVITAKTPGKATITVRSKENNKISVCTVTVIERVKSVSVSTTAETLYVDKDFIGETLLLKATVSPSNATYQSVTWTSSDPSVAKVSSAGLVTAVRSGVAVITVTTVDGEKTASCTVTVLQSASGITIENPTLTVNKGQTIKINAVVGPEDAYNKNIRWIPENEAIAKIDEYGRVTGIAVGKTTVTAITVDGEFRASCLVTVNEPVTDVKLNVNEVPVLYVGNTVTLTPTVYPDFIPDENINREVIWSTSDENIATVKNGVVTPLSAGEVTITVTTVDGSFTDTCKINCFIPVGSITTEQNVYYIKVGAQQKVNANVLPGNASFPGLEWNIISGEEYFTCEDGVITGIRKGNGIINIASVDNPSVTKEVEICIIKKVESVSFDESEVTLNKGETYILTPSVMPADAHNKNVTFISSDENIVSVDENGNVTATGKGTATVTVTTEDEGCTAECTFNVRQLVEEITFPESQYVVAEGKNITLCPTVLPENANDKNIEWQSSDLSVATVTDGVVTGVKVGETTISAIAKDSGNIETTVKLTVVKHAEKIELTANADTLWVGDSTTVTATVLPEDTTDKAVTFTSSDENIATVDNEGKVTAVSADGKDSATVVITAVSACMSAEGQYVLTVRQPATDIEIAEETVVLELGDDYDFEPVVLPETAFDKTVTYISSDESIITVKDGKITTVGTGEATVTLKSACGKAEKKCNIKVIVLPTGIETEREISLEKTKTYDLEVVLAPDNVTQTKITYTSANEDIATVDENGVITAHKAGTAVIRAQTETEGVFAECEVTVYVNSEKIELSAEEHDIYIGEEFTLGATVLPEDTTNKNVTYTSSDENIIKVTADGKVSALAKGTATVTVTAEDTGITSVCKVNVKKHAQGITMADKAVVYAGRSVEFNADVFPADADNRNIIWTVSDTEIASIDENGVFTAREKGFVLVTAETEDGGFKAVCSVEIKIGVDSVSFNEESILLDRGASETLTVSVFPANTDEKEVTWTSSDESVATVDSEGKVTATQKSGTAVIRAVSIDNAEAYAECTVTVKVPLESIALEQSSFALRKNETVLLAVNYSPANTTVKDVTFESDNEEIASVDENGLITAHKAGEAKITVTSLEGGYTVVCRIKVYSEIESLVALPLTIKQGSQASCRIVANPYNHDETLIYISDNENIATVDSNGLVTAKAEGIANITVKGSISGKTCTFAVTVTVANS